MNPIRCPTFLLALSLILAPDTVAGATDLEETLTQLRQAYIRLEALELEAMVTVEYDVAGVELKRELAYSAALATDGGFRHEIPGQLVVAGDSDATYVYVPQIHRYYRSERAARFDLDPAAREVLFDHNLSLLLALSPDASELLRSAGAVSAGEGRAKLILDRQDGSRWAIELDPSTHLVRRIEVDEAEVLRRAGAKGVGGAFREIRYTRVDALPAVREARVAFSPPADAQQVERAGPPTGGGSLAGKPAPDLSLPDLEGTRVMLSELGGQVVLIDFWASWCGPCVHGLPHIATLARERAGDGLVVLAVNLREDEATIRRFLADQPFDAAAMRVLRDSDGAAARQWGVMAIPHTVVIGRDGVVREVIVGLSPDRLARAVADALAE